MLLSETFRMVYLKCVLCNGELVNIAFCRKTQNTLAKKMSTPSIVFRGLIAYMGML